MYPRQMNLRAAVHMLFVLTITFTLPLIAQEHGAWRASSKTAQSITGDVTFNGDRLMINFYSFAVAEICSLKPAEVSAAFDVADAGLGGSPDAPADNGHLFRISIPGDRRFLHKNMLCGSDETQWMATYIDGKQLQIAFFSNAAPAVFTVEALRDSPNLCGTNSYQR